MMRVRKISCIKCSYVVVVCQKILTYDQMDLAATRNYLTDHITTKPIRKIDSESSL